MIESQFLKEQKAFNYFGVHITISTDMKTGFLWDKILVHYFICPKECLTWSKSGEFGGWVSRYAMLSKCALFGKSFSACTKIGIKLYSNKKREQYLKMRYF
jgi:hypothetical protein